MSFLKGRIFNTKINNSVTNKSLRITYSKPMSLFSIPIGPNFFFPGGPVKFFYQKTLIDHKYNYNNMISIRSVFVDTDML